MAGLVDTNTEGAPDFDTAMRAAEETAGVPSDAELYGDAFSTPDPDETGRVPSPSPPRDDDGNPVEVEETPAEETPAEETEAVPMQVPLAEGTLEAKYADLEAKFADVNRRVGQFANENAELRKRDADREQEWANQPQAAPDNQTLAWFDEIVEQAPDQAAVWAAQQQQPLLYERAIRSWHDVDPVAAARYERSMELGEMQRMLSAQLQPQIQGAQDLANQNDLQAALRAVQGRHDDFDQVVAGITDEMAQGILESAFPAEILPSLIGSKDGKEKVLETLYRFVKSEQAPAMVQGAVEAVQASKEEAKDKKRAATVASASTSTPEPVEETEGERLSRVWGEQRPNLRSAWEGRKV